jgi:hypothetical protein
MVGRRILPDDFPGIAPDDAVLLADALNVTGYEEIRNTDGDPNARWPWRTGTMVRIFARKELSLDEQAAAAKKPSDGTQDNPPCNPGHSIPY